MGKRKSESVVVVWNGGVREYSSAVHGDDFRALADEFATKKGGKVEEVEAE